MFFRGLIFDIPTGVVWLAGLFYAIGQWNRYPRVSAAVLVSLGCMLSAVIGQAVGLPLLFSSNMPWSILEIRLDVGLGVLASLVRAVGWAAILTAIFGWREGPPYPDKRSPLQFNIRSLLVLTLMVAVLCGMARGLFNLLGNAWMFYFDLLDELPTLICWLYGGWLAWTRRNRHPQVARRVAIAIGLSFSAFAGFVKIFTSSSGDWYLGVGLFSDLLAEPISWILLLSAAFGWREADPLEPRGADAPVAA